MALARPSFRIDPWPHLPLFRPLAVGRLPTDKRTSHVRALGSWQDISAAGRQASRPAARKRREKLVLDERFCGLMALDRLNAARTATSTPCRDTHSHVCGTLVCRATAGWWTFNMRFRQATRTRCNTESVCVKCTASFCLYLYSEVREGATASRARDAVCSLRRPHCAMFMPMSMSISMSEYVPRFATPADVDTYMCGYIRPYAGSMWRRNSSWPQLLLLPMLLMLHAACAATTVCHCFALNAIYVAVSRHPLSPRPRPCLCPGPSHCLLCIVRSRVFGFWHSVFRFQFSVAGRG